MLKFFRARLSRKLSALGLLLAVIICVSSCVSGYLLCRNSTYKSYNDFAYEVATIARSYVNGNTITSYLDESHFDKNGVFVPDAAYYKMRDGIYSLYVNLSMHKYKSGIYICIPEKTEDGKYLLTNLFDVRIVEAADEVKKYYDVGVVDPMGVDNPEEVMKIFYTGERSSDFFVHESSFGFNSTAILPVKDSTGTPVALLMADMPMPYVSETLQQFLFNTIFITVLVVALFMGLFIRITNKVITKPISVIANEAEAFTESDIKISDKLNKFEQIDEIGHLASSIYRMENDIQTYVTNLTQVTAEKERIGAELDVATNIQKSMLPCIFPAFPDVPEIDIYATMNAAKEVGGDFYDFFMVDDTHIAVVVADVSGKGVPAALFMVIGKTLIKDHTAPGRPINEVFNEVNNLLCESNEGGLFITAFEGVLDLETGEFNFVNAGHETPFIYKKNGTYEEYKVKPGFVLAGMEGMQYKMGSVTLEEGDKLFQYTDGVTEATNASNELYGMERLQKALNDNGSLTPCELLPKIKEDIDKFVGDAPQFDDITMLSLEFKKKMKR